MNQVLAIVLFTFQISLFNCGRTCLSCTGVGSVRECTEVEVCGNDEVCFTHKFFTKTQEVSYNYGCTFHQFCSSGSSDSDFGDCPAARHLVCQTCCNGTDICNIKSSCEPEGSSNTISSQVTKDQKKPRECDDLLNTTTGVYTIYPDGLLPVQVYCIMANNEKWTVIQKRYNGYVSIDRTWEEYKKGFGSVRGEYWLGNEHIHQISTSTGHMLSIYMEDFTGGFAYANYSVFDLGNEQRKYQLRINEFTGTPGLSDYFSAHNTHLFTTKDQNNDIGENCAVHSGGNGGWWYMDCADVNLNGPYMAGPVSNITAMFWLNWPTSYTYYSLKKSTMMIKRFQESPKLGNNHG